MKPEKQVKNKFIILVLRYLTISSFFIAVAFAFYWSTNKKENSKNNPPPIVTENSLFKMRPQILPWATIGVKSISCPDYVDLNVVFESIKNKTIFEHPCLIVYQK